MVTFFANQYQDFAERPLCVVDLLKDPQFARIGSLGANGGTELGPALGHVLEVVAQNSQGRAKNLILITDAQIGNEPAILKSMRSVPDLPVHCFGIDVALNDALLIALCRQQGGTFHSLNPGDDIKQAMLTLGKTLDQPVLLDLQLSDGWEIPDASIRNLYAGEVQYLSARCRANASLSLRARGSSRQPIEMGFETQRTALSAPYLHWSRHRIQRFLAEGKNAEAIALSIQSNQICSLTSFIAWDKTEKVAVATHKLIQPNCEVAFAGVEKFQRISLDTLYCGLRAPDESDLRRELPEMCTKIGLPNWQELVKTILDWITAVKGVQRTEAIEAFASLVQWVRFAIDRLDLSDESRVEVARNKVRVLLEEFIDRRCTEKAG
jgi:hypothetical protein